MPSQRKRIGFLPRAEVQTIIDQICNQNKLSQSKVTGILVEEALTSRGVLNSSINKTSIELDNNKNKTLLITNNNFNNQISDDNFDLNDGQIKNEVKMINDYIEFKFFKRIMNKNRELKD